MAVEIKDYDHLEYSNQMFYFNTISRVALYPGASDRCFVRKRHNKFSDSKCASDDNFYDICACLGADGERSIGDSDFKSKAMSMTYLDHCYDCTVEIRTFVKYLQKFSPL